MAVCIPSWCRGRGSEILPQKVFFLAGLVRICDKETLPLLVGGDFNIMHRQILTLDGLLFLMLS